MATQKNERSPGSGTGRGPMLLALLALALLPAYGAADPEQTGSLGIWTYGKPLEKSMAGSSRYLDDETLRMLGNAGVYFIYGTSRAHLGAPLADNLTRCKIAGVEVHLSITPAAQDVEFVNIWSFGTLRHELEETLAFLEDAHLLRDPVTTLVYDMEPLVERHFPLYGMDLDVIRALKRHRMVQKQFIEFNRHVRETYGLDIQICSDISQAIDPIDGDNDLAWLFGLMSDPHASRSFMAYRHDTFDPGFILGHCARLEAGDTIILSAWKKEGDMCWGDLECAIQDARLVMEYRGKDLKLEIWALWYFLKSYGKEGLVRFVDAVCVPPDARPAVPSPRKGPFSVVPDLLFAGIRVLDFIGPFLKGALGAV